ncbi:uncharacterized protein K452DRAFT_250230 [Aplosporella prunicola CBS 121167]|uniref:Zn(2)-C6 fungal-type domain-containing protein n=1 Tax=Aplosporella prunicola CBS 121167 TaxID=1176127 RepID=A0A6A6BBX9_9PEZI|nr:uncharacterized protein K452DRAFT_250230 [Aplosporella prunicola CBS 121167]KAF2141546.1 hypothetical protein K452DRAFT_250230 [Aplosporella prunicola CBS 121167]
MVFCGAPSRGCEACRKRKIRCDKTQLPAGCGQCAKAKRTCPGYRDLGQVLFRHESAKVERRVRGTGRAGGSVGSGFSPVSSAGASPDYSSGEILFLPQEGPSIHYALTPTPDDLAAGFFFANFCNHVAFSASSNAHNNAHGVVAAAGPDTDLWASGIDTHLYTSMLAVGLYGLARHSGNPAFARLATQRYTDAIHATNGALRDAAVATRDSSLLAVIILGLFESLTGRTKASLQAWEQHIKGASALVSLRGKRQLETAVGRRMFMQITSSLLISCIQRDIPFPAPIKRLMDLASEEGQLERSHPFYRLREIMVQVADFRAEWLNASPSASNTTTPLDPHTTITRALHLDGLILSLIASLPPSFAYTTHPVFPPAADPDVCPTAAYHTYPGFWLAQLWNSMRCCRLLLHGMLRQALLAGLGGSPPAFGGEEGVNMARLFAEREGVVQELVRDVLRSVPCHVGYVSARAWRERLFAGGVETPLAHLPLVRSQGSMMLLWTLFLVGSLDATGSETKRWVIRALERLGAVMGVGQGGVLGGILRGAGS